MKKVMSLVFIISLFFFCGCEKQEQKEAEKKPEDKIATLVCTKTEEDEDGETKVDTFEITSKNNIVKKVTNSTTTVVDEDSIDLAISLTESFIKSFNEVDGMDASISKESNNTYKLSLSVDYDVFNIEQAKEKLGDMFDEEDFLSEKDITVDQFKEKNLEGYECK